MEAVLLLLLLLWVISPIPLFILYMGKRKAADDKEREIYYLKEEIKTLLAGREPHRADADKDGRQKMPPADDAVHRDSHYYGTGGTPLPDYTLTAAASHTTGLLVADTEPVFRDTEDKVPREKSASLFAEAAKSAAEDIKLEVPKAAASVSGNIREILPEMPQEDPAPVTDTARESAFQQYSSEPEPARRSRVKIRPVNLILALGTLFVTLAGFVFAIAAWGELPAAGKAALLCSFSAVFFILHLVTEKKLELSSAGKVFYILGSAFLPAAVFSAAVLRIFGDAFSFASGGGLVIAVMAFAVCVCAFIGAVHYDSRVAARTGFIAATVCAASLSVHIGGVYTALCLSLFALFSLLLEKRFTANDSIRSVIRDEFRFFVTENIYVCALVSLFLSDGSVIYAVPVLIFSSSFLVSSVRREHGSADISAFAAYLMIGAYLTVRPDEYDSILLTAALVITVYSILSMLDMIPQGVRKIVSVIRMIATVILIIAGLAGNFAQSEFSSAVMISAVCVVAQLAIMTYRGDKPSLYALAPAVVFAAYECSKLFGEYAPIAVSAALLAFLIFTRIAGRSRTLFSDIVLCAVVLLQLLIHAADGSCQLSDKIVSVLVWSILTVMTFICAASPDGGSTFGKIGCTVAVLFAVIPAYIITESFEDAFPLLLIVYFAVSAAVLFIPEKYLGKTSEYFLWGWGLLCVISVLAGLSSGFFTIWAPVCSALYFGAYVLLLYRGRLSESMSAYDIHAGVFVCIVEFSLLLLRWHERMDVNNGLMSAVVASAAFIFTSCIAEKRVSRWALPVSVMGLSVPLVSLTELTGISKQFTDGSVMDSITGYSLTILIYGIITAVFIHKGSQRKNSFVYLFPLLFVFTLSDSNLFQRNAFVIIGCMAAVIVVCTVLLRIRKESDAPAAVFAVSVAVLYWLSLAYDLLSIGNGNKICAVCIFFIMTAILLSEKHKVYTFVVPPSILLLAAPLEETKLFGYRIEALLPLVLFLAAAAASVRFEKLRQSLRICAPFCLAYPMFYRSAEAPFVMLLCAGIFCVTYAVMKDETRKTLNTVMFSVCSAVLFGMAAKSAYDLRITQLSFAESDITRILTAFVPMIIWIMAVISLTCANMRRRTAVLEIGISVVMICIYFAVDAIVLAFWPPFPFSEVYGITAAVAALCAYRLISIRTGFVSASVQFVFVPLAAVITLVTIECSPIAAAVIVLLTSAADAYIGIKSEKKVGCYTLLSSVMITAIVIAWHFVYRMDAPGYVNYIAAAASAVLCLLPMCGKNKTFSGAAADFGFVVLPAAAVVLAVLSANDPGIIPVMCAYTAGLAAVIPAFAKKNTLLLYIMYIVMYVSASMWLRYCGLSEMFVMLFAALPVIFGRLYFSENICRDGLLRFSDAFTLSAFAAAVMLLSCGKEKPVWFGILFCAVLFVLLHRPKNNRVFDQSVLTLSALCIMPLWWMQPFFTVPDIIRTECALVPPVAVLALLYLIHRRHRRIIDIFSFITAIADLVILFFDAANTGYAADAVLLGAVILCILALSFIFRQKRWFVLAVVSAAAEALLMTLKLWDNRTWWIYLLAAGVILLSVGISNEMKKKRIEKGIKTKLETVMEEWTW